jgi:phosphate transport system substrate-binding protein
MKPLRLIRSLGPLMLLALACPALAQSVLVGAGATFPQPIYTRWFQAYEESHPGSRIRYEGGGSESGIRRLREGSVDFAASDMPLDDAQLAQLGRPVLQLPSTLGAVVPVYHLEGFAQQLRLTPEALAGIYLGRVRRWNDLTIQSANKGLTLPDRAIHVVHRSDGSGTTFVWTDYLSKISADWKSKPGTGTSVSWPVGEGAEGNEGVARAVAGTPDSIGYAEFIYALFNRLSYAFVRNAAGAFVQADLESIAAAAASTAQAMPPNFRISITDAPGRKSYPVAAFTYLLVPVKAVDIKKGALVRDLLGWIFTSGQRQSAALGYGTLPSGIIRRAQQALDSLE